MTGLSAPLRSRLALTVAVALLACISLGNAAAPDQGDKVNINTATAAQLETLPRIGPAVAQRIIEYREKNGPFKRASDLLNVRGVGEKTFEVIKDRIVVSGGRDGG